MITNVLPPFYGSQCTLLLCVHCCNSTAVVAEYTPCNRSLGVGICPLSYQCYELARSCDGIVDCTDGYDEIACKYQVHFHCFVFLLED